MDTAPFEKLTNHLGLVPMVITKDHTPYFVGKVAGFPPDEAATRYELNAAVPCDVDGKPIPFETGEVENGQAILDAPFTVEIPEDWESQHALQRIKIARNIKPDAGSIKAAEADEIVRAELERRG